MFPDRCHRHHVVDIESAVGSCPYQASILLAVIWMDLRYRASGPSRQGLGDSATTLASGSRDLLVQSVTQAVAPDHRSLLPPMDIVDMVLRIFCFRFAKMTVHDFEDDRTRLRR